MKISLIYGSVREGRLGIRAVVWIKEALINRGHHVTLIDPKEHSFPLLNKMYKEYSPGEAPPVIEEVHKSLLSSDGFVLVSGEYNHSIPPALKNILDHFQSEYHFKPSALVTYSVGSFGGVRVGPHLRAITGELGMPSIPTALPISKIKEAFTESGELVEKAYERRLDRFLTEFEWYLEAFSRQRNL